MASPAPFSLEYLNFFHNYQPGWYMNINDWNHHVYTVKDENPLSISRIHFELSKPRKHPLPDYNCKIGCLSFRRAKEELESFGYYRLRDDDKLLTYYLKDYGFMKVHLRLRLLFCEDWMKYPIHQDQPIKLSGNFPGRFFCKFEVVLTQDLKLIVDLDPPGQNPDQIQELSPITFEITKDYKFLTWEGGDPIPMTMREDFNFKDEKYVEYVLYDEDFLEKTKSAFI